jgi:hypothetical protein
MSAIGKMCRSTRRRGTAEMSHFSPIRVLDTSLPASGSVDMNEQAKLGSEQGGLNVHFWVLPSED